MFSFFLFFNFSFNISRQTQRGGKKRHEIPVGLETNKKKKNRFSRSRRQTPPSYITSGPYEFHPAYNIITISVGFCAAATKINRPTVMNYVSAGTPRNRSANIVADIRQPLSSAVCANIVTVFYLSVATRRYTSVTKTLSGVAHRRDFHK